MSGTSWLRNLPGGKKDRRFPNRQTDGGIQKRNVDLLTFAGPERMNVSGQDSLCAIHPRRKIGDGNPNLRWRAVGISGNADEPARGLGDKVETTPFTIISGLTEAGNRTVDQLRIKPVQV